MNKDRLEDLRKKIEAIDDQILHLLQQRAEVVHDVSLYKQGLKDDLFVRPLREAVLLKKFDTFQQNVTNKALYNYNSDFYRHFLRLVISASNQLEQEFCVGFTEESSIVNICFYYGAFCKKIQFNTFTECLNDIIDKKVQVAFVPFDTFISNDDFAKMRQNNIFIFAQTSNVNTRFKNNFILGRVRFTEEDISLAAKSVYFNQDTGLSVTQNLGQQSVVAAKNFAGFLF
jgi:chorismate mutase